MTSTSVSSRSRFGTAVVLPGNGYCWLGGAVASFNKSLSAWINSPTAQALIDAFAEDPVCKDQPVWIDVDGASFLHPSLATQFLFWYCPAEGLWLDRLITSVKAGAIHGHYRDWTPDQYLEALDDRDDDPDEW